MKLYIVRHGIAVDHGTPGVAEAERPLTEEGIRKMEEAAKGLRAIAVAPDAILTSPLPRAARTAQILAARLGVRAPLEEVEALEPGGSRDGVYDEIRARRDLEALMLVGHQPGLGEIAGEIAFGSAGAALDLKKGGACAIEIERFLPAPRGTLLWFLTPRVMRGLR